MWRLALGEGGGGRNSVWTIYINLLTRSTIDEVAKQYVCPITAELPIDPVTAR